MAQLTYPESMERLDVQDTGKSLSIIEAYIGYICERTDFAMRNMTKQVNAAGVSSVEMYILVQAQAQAVATLQSTVGQLSGSVTGLQQQLATLRDTVGDANGGLVKDVADIKEEIGDAQTSGSILYQLADLDQRVTALEHPQPSNP